MLRPELIDQRIFVQNLYVSVDLAKAGGDVLGKRGLPSAGHPSEPNCKALILGHLLVDPRLDTMENPAFYKRNPRS